MRKFVVVLVIVLALVCGAAVFFAGSLMRGAVEKGGTHALGVKTTLGSASLSPMAGRVGLNALQVDNPSGFKSPYFVKIDDARLSVSTASLLHDVVDAPSFELDGLDLYLERAEGHTNYGAILDSLERLQGKPDKSDKKKPEGGKKFIVRDVRLRNLRVHTDVVPELGESAKVALTIPEVHLTNVGNAEGGASVPELVGALIQAVLTAAVQTGSDQLPKALLGDLSGSLSKLDSNLVKDLEKQVGSKTIDELGKGLEKVFK